MANGIDMIVISAGRIGSVAAYHLAQTGHQELLLDQFYLGQQQDSSHGNKPINRSTADILDCTGVMGAAFKIVAPTATGERASAFAANQGAIFGPRAAAPLRSTSRRAHSPQLPLPDPNKNASILAVVTNERVLKVATPVIDSHL